jgi:rhamnosyltransferase
MSVTVAIPSLNGGRLLVSVINSLTSQQVSYDYCILVIDSGSSDGTIDFLRDQHSCSRIRLVEIPPEDFGHGKTRNLAVDLSTTDLVAFLTQDALPKNNLWLSKLAEPFFSDRSIAGCFGRHMAYPTADKKTISDIEEFMKSFDEKPHVINMQSLIDYSTDETVRQFAHFYSDNNSCLRKDVWKRIPYPDVSYGEDQLWAKAIIEAGYSKAYAQEAVVFHSHDYGPFEQYARSRVDRRFWVQHFGYVSVTSYASALSEAFRQFKAHNNWYKLNNVTRTLPSRVRSAATLACRFIGEYHGYRDALAYLREQC